MSGHCSATIAALTTRPARMVPSTTGRVLLPRLSQVIVPVTPLEGLRLRRASPIFARFRPPRLDRGDQQVHAVKGVGRRVIGRCT